MTTKAISVTQLKQNLGTLINEASYGGQRIILLSHGKAKAALISMEDLRFLEACQKENQRHLYQSRQLNLLGELQQLRESAGDAGYQTDSEGLLDEVRGERLDDLTDLC